MSRKKKQEPNLPKVMVDDMVIGTNPNFPTDPNSEYHIRGTVEAEVLTVHFRTESMRVRYTDQEGKIRTYNVGIEPFLDLYNVVEKEQDAKE